MEVNAVGDLVLADPESMRAIADPFRLALLDRLRRGGPATDAELASVIREAVWRKELKHHVGEPGFRQPPRTMSAIGG